MGGRHFVCPLRPYGYATLSILAWVIERELWLSYMSGSTSTDAILILVTATDRIVPAARRDRYSTRTLGPDSSTISADQRDVRTESASTLKPYPGRAASMFLNTMPQRRVQWRKWPLARRSPP